MIRSACFTACATATLLTAQSASAAVNLNGRISQVVNALHDHAQFSPRDFGFMLNWKDGTMGRLFIGLEGVRELNGGDVYRINEWLDQTPAPAPGPGDVYNGGSYTFTHAVVGSFFDNQAQGDGGSSAVDGEPYKFTHDVLDSYFGDDEQGGPDTTSGDGEDSFALFVDPPFAEDVFTQDVVISDPDAEEPPVIQARMIEPPVEEFVVQVPAAIPEPASWAMMIGGFAVVGASMRCRAAARLA